MIQRDYIERLIEQCAEALRQALRLRRSRELEPALRVLRDAEDQILGPLRSLVEQLEASSAVQVAGPSQVERLRLYASLIGEEAVVHRARGDASSAFLAGRRALELYAAVSLAGVQMRPDDRERIRVLTRLVGAGGLDPAYRDELRRVTR
jgi:hypothetical protein